jgi:hypothetical protein
MVEFLWWRLPYLRSWNPSESIRIRLSTDSVRIRSPFLQGRNAHTYCTIPQKNPLRGCSESARIRPNPTLHRIRPNPEPPSQLNSTCGQLIEHLLRGPDVRWGTIHADVDKRTRHVGTIRAEVDKRTRHVGTGTRVHDVGTTATSILVELSRCWRWGGLN